MNVAAELTRARKKHGLSLEELSSRTKVSVERLAAIERADLDQLPPDIYLRGFVRAYAAEVGLDPDDVSARYLAHFQREQNALAEFDSEDEFEQLDEVRPARSSSLLDVDGSLRAPIVAGEPYASGARSSRSSRTHYGWLAVVAALAVIGGYLLSANYERLAPALRTAASMAGVRTAERPEQGSTAPNDDVDSSAAQPARAPSAEADASAGDAAKTSQAIEPDRSPAAAVPSHAARDTTESPRPQTEARVPTQPATPSTPPAMEVPPGSTPRNADRDRVAPGARAAAPTEAAGQAATSRQPDTTPVEPTPQEEPRVDALPLPPPEAENVAGEPPADDVTGAWTMINHIRSTSYNRFKDLTLGYRLQLQQNGNRVTGSGLKWLENGREIAAGSRTPITIDGMIEGRRLELRFTERGRRRASAGVFLLQVADDGSLRGGFTSDAAQSSGSSQARRITSGR